MRKDERLVLPPEVVFRAVAGLIGATVSMFYLDHLAEKQRPCQRCGCNVFRLDEYPWCASMAERRPRR